MSRSLPVISVSTAGFMCTTYTLVKASWVCLLVEVTDYVYHCIIITIMSHDPHYRLFVSTSVAGTMWT